MTDLPLTAREQAILKLVVEHHIREGQPVASKIIAAEPALSVSPATIRNVLVDLEERGYVVSPHASAGRLPTTQGYRFFIDSIVVAEPFDEQQLHSVEQELTLDVSTDRLLNHASMILSRLTEYTGLVTLPKQDSAVLRHIEFLTLSDTKILAVLVLNGDEVQNRVIKTERAYSAAELQQMANFLNEHCCGKHLHSTRQVLVQALEQARADIGVLTQQVLDIANVALEVPNREDDYVMAGESNLLNTVTDSSVDQLRALFDGFSQKRDILQLLDRCLVADGVQIFMGDESGHTMLSDYSLVSSAYQIDGKAVGVLGVIGPKRMPYQRVISAVEVTARLLGGALKSLNST